MKKLYFIHPETKGRIDLTLPKDKAEAVVALLEAQGYRQVSAAEYSAWARRYPLAELDAKAQD